MEGIVGDAVQYFCLESSDYFIALPTCAIVPDIASNSFRSFNKCPLCGRYSELLWGVMAAEIASDITIGVFHLENRMGITPVWVLTKALYSSLNKAAPKFKGFVKDSLVNVVKVKK